MTTPPRWIAVLLLLPTLARAAGPDPVETRLVAQPAVSKDHIAFIYADDLWVADRDGKNVRRLTSDLGVEMRPVFSPDGQTIAFSAEYDGNIDVFTIPTAGGSPTRLTWHPSPDIVRGWTPDGAAVLFSSGRSSFTNRYTQLFTVPASGGFPTPLPIPNGVEASYSPDGLRIAYTPIADRSPQWKHYRGGTASRIWLFTYADKSVEQIPQPEGRCNDLDPHWVNGTIYFRSDRAGEFNLFGYDCATRQVRQLTKFTDFPVLNLATGGGRLVFEQAGYLHTFDPDTGSSGKLTIGVAADLLETRPRFVKGEKYIRNAAISPSGSRAVFEVRGEIVSVPAEKGDPRNVTNTPGAHERDPIWSPDGKSIAYFSDAVGEYTLYVRDQDGKNKPRIYRLDGAGFYERPLWSPDGKKIAYTDNSQSLYSINLTSGDVTRIATEPHYSPLKSMRFAWSPDSKWLAFTLGNLADFHTAYVYSFSEERTRPVTDGLSDIDDVAFDANGLYLYMLASTEAGPVRQWFAQSNADMRAEYALYVAVLAKKTPAPFAKESDEEKGDDKPKDADKKKGDDKIPEPVVIDFDGLDQRIVNVPVPAGFYTALHGGAPGTVYYLSRSDAPDGDDDEAPPGGAGAKLVRFDIGKRKAETIRKGVSDYRLSPDGKKLLTFTAPDSWAITDAAPGLPPGKGKLHTGAIEIKIDPRAEWSQIFDEAWRINRDYFYATNFHGADWPAVRAKYAAFLPHLATRDDLNRVIRWMASELSVGHSYLSGGDRLYESKKIPGGLLGADFAIENGRYRFAKVFGGLNWNPDLRAPLTGPGVDVKVGDYLLAVQGHDLKAPTNLFSLFENTAGKAIGITVGPNADGKDSRTVTVEPIADESALRNRAWVEGNLKKVREATGGKVAYVYVPDTAGRGHAAFKRYFYPQSDRQAIIVDERFNGGGSVADYYIDHLRRPFTAYWTTRYGLDQKTPGAAIFGPKVMLIDETAGSGGDLLPWMFRHYKLGPLVGKRTWGGLVGILGYPVLMDGGRITAPNLAFWTPEEGYGIENVGVPPDVEVEQWPAEVIAGKDPQLERAIQIALDELAKNPPKEPKRPPFPVRAK